MQHALAFSLGLASVCHRLASKRFAAIFSKHRLRWLFLREGASHSVLAASPHETIAAGLQQGTMGEAPANRDLSFPPMFMIKIMRFRLPALQSHTSAAVVPLSGAPNLAASVNICFYK